MASATAPAASSLASLPSAAERQRCSSPASLPATGGLSPCSSRGLRLAAQKCGTARTAGGRSFAVRALAPERHFAAEVKTQPISFQFDETSFSVQFTPELARQLKDAIDKLLTTFREKEKATRPQRWESLEFRHAGDGVYVEVFCNPNAYSNAFQAKALVTVRSDTVRLSSEGPLSNVKSSVEEYLAAN